MRKHIYPPKLEQFMKEENRIYIPRKINKDEHLKLYKRYWNNFSEIFFKVYAVYSVDNYEYYSVKYPDSLLGEFSYPVNYEYTYELMIDKNNIIKKKNIINDGKRYTGAEIKFWFFINNIDLESNKYKGFWNSIRKLVDTKFYYITAELRNDIYIKCKFSYEKK